MPDRYTLTLCEQIKKATDNKNSISLEDAFIALSKLDREVSICKNEQYKDLIKQIFYYLTHQELKRCEDVKFSKSIGNLLKIDSNFTAELKEEREKKNTKSEQKNLNYRESINKLFLEIFDNKNKYSPKIPSQYLRSKIYCFLKNLKDRKLRKKINRQLNTIVRFLRNQKIAENAAESISLTIDVIPRIKKILESGYSQKLGEFLIEKALDTTKKDIIKDLHKFKQRYNIDFDNDDNIDFDNIKESFIKWVSMILKNDCRDIYRSNKNNQQPTNNPLSLNSSISSGLFSGQNNDRDNNSLEKIISSRSIDGTPTLSGLNLLIKNEKESLAEIFSRCIQDDQNDELQTIHIRNRPECNCQVLLTKRLLENKTLEQIAKELNTQTATLQDYITWRQNTRRPGGKCFRELIEKIQRDRDINIDEYK